MEIICIPFTCNLEKSNNLFLKLSKLRAPLFQQGTIVEIICIVFTCNLHLHTKGPRNQAFPTSKYSYK